MLCLARSLTAASLPAIRSRLFVSWPDCRRVPTPGAPVVNGLSRNEGKLSSTVLRGGRAGNCPPPLGVASGGSPQMIFEHSGTLYPSPCTRQRLTGSWALSARWPKRLGRGSSLRTQDEPSWVQKPRSDPDMPVKWLAARVQIGTAKEAKSALYYSAREQRQRKPAKVDVSRAQLEFQSTV